MVDVYASLELIRTDPAPHPCRACGLPTTNIWALTDSDAERLFYSEYRACSIHCAENLAHETAMYA